MQGTYEISPELYELNSLYERMLETALVAHKGQVDKNGVAYVTHPIRVAEKISLTMPMKTRLAAKVVSLGHDLFEDTKITPEILKAYGFPEWVVDCISILTHKKGEPYEDYIQRILNTKTFEGMICKFVKLADLDDNMDLTRLPGYEEKDIKRLAKYEEARKKILEEF